MNCATTNRQVCKRRYELRDYKRVRGGELRDYERVYGGVNERGVFF